MRAPKPHRDAGRRAASVNWIRTGVPFLLILFACSGDRADSQGTTVRDSAGVEIVDNPGDLWSTEDRWHVSSEPVLRIGVVEGEAAYLFDGVRGVVVLSDGRIVVANRGDSSLRWYDSDGTFLFRRGGPGDGPGEFSRLGEITWIAGDTVVAVDWSNNRFTLFGPDGGLGPSRMISGLTAPPGRMHRLPGGNLIVGISGFSTTQLPTPEPGVFRLDSPVLQVSADGLQTDTVGMFPASEIEVRATGSSLRFLPARFGRSLGYGVSGDHIIVGTADRLEVGVYSPEGQLVRSFRAPDVSNELTPRIEAAYRDYQHERLARLTPEQRVEAERSLASMQFPPTVPAYASVVVDGEGNVWLGEYRFDLATPRRFLVFDPNGRFITAITLPPDVRVMTIARGQIWGRMTDDLDVQYVVGYSITK